MVEVLQILFLVVLILVRCYSMYTPYNPSPVSMMINCPTSNGAQYILTEEVFTWRYTIILGWILNLFILGWILNLFLVNEDPNNRILIVNEIPQNDLLVPEIENEDPDMRRTHVP